MAQSVVHYFSLKVNQMILSDFSIKQQYDTRYSQRSKFTGKGTMLSSNFTKKKKKAKLLKKVILSRALCDKLYPA